MQVHDVPCLRLTSQTQNLKHIINRAPCRRDGKPGLTARGIIRSLNDRLSEAQILFIYGTHELSEGKDMERIDSTDSKRSARITPLQLPSSGDMFIFVSISSAGKRLFKPLRGSGEYSLPLGQVPSIISLCMAKVLLLFSPVGREAEQNLTF